MTPFAIISQVASETGVSVAQLKGPRRWKHIVLARKLAARRLRDSGCSYPYIGMILNRASQTIMYELGDLGRQQKTAGNA